MPSIKFSDVWLKRIKATKQTRWFEKIDRGVSLALTVSPGGSKSWGVLLYDANGRSKLHGLKNEDGRPARYPRVTLADARRLAVNAHHTPETVQPKVDVVTFGHVAEGFFRQADQRGVRTVGDMRSSYRRYLSQWSSLPISEIKRSQIVTLRDQIAYGEIAPALQRRDGWRKAVKLKGGTRTADSIISLLRTIFNWWHERSDEFVNPMSRGMKLAGGGTKRERVLDDDEIRALWQATEPDSPVGILFSSFCRLGLLCGQREAKIINMRWGDVDPETGLWTLPREPREKPNTGQIILPPLALSILDAMPRYTGGDLIFSVDGKTVFNSFATYKVRLDRIMQVEGWVLHDLRRSTRTLLSRVGVSAEVGERVLGHVVGGTIQGIYDRHDYLAEKSAALAKVADEVTRIVGLNVVQLVAAR